MGVEVKPLVKLLPWYAIISDSFSVITKTDNITERIDILKFAIDVFQKKYNND